MKKTLKILLLFVVAISMTACGGDKKEKPKEPKKQENSNDNNTNAEVEEMESGSAKEFKNAYYNELPLPENVDHVDKNKKGEDKTEYIMFVGEYSYNKFYEYIMKLEKLGFHYEFVKECVPKNEKDLIDKTETSWAANNGKIWLRISWRSKENQYYSDYNMQIIFNNYDYLLPLEEETKQEENKEKTSKQEDTKKAE